MPAISTPKPDAEPFLIMATEVHKLLTRPVGTEHARIRQLAKVLRDLANTNYDRGWNDALEAGGAKPVGEPAQEGDLVRVTKHSPDHEGTLMRDGEGRLTVNLGNGYSTRVEEGEYELVSRKGGPYPIVGSRVRIEGAPADMHGRPLNGRVGKVGHIGEDVTTLTMEDDGEVMGVNKVYLKPIF